jgi:very-short-patch-repair endonuclease
MEHLVATVERRLDRYASSTWGLVKRRELLRVGITRQEIRRRLECGTLIAVHRGVYRVGHRAPSAESRYLAAVWACGDRAKLSGLAAGYLLSLLRCSAPPPEVIAPARRRVPGVKTARFIRLHPEDAITWRGIPVTSVARTLVDLAAVLPPDALARACHEAGVKHGTTPADVRRALARRPNAKGARELRAIMSGDTRVVLSRLERRFLEHLSELRLPLPQTNRPAGGYRVDCRWPEHLLTVELNSYKYHGSRHAWEADQDRQREAYERGDQFRSYTWGDVFERPARMRAELRGLLTQSDGT